MGTVVTTNNGKQFEKPASGMFHGVLADVVDLGDVTTTYQGVSKTQRMIRLIWILDTNGTDGKPLSVAVRFNANLHEKSNLYKTLKQVLNSAPPATFDIDTLIGQTRQLFIVREKSADGTKDYANIQGIAPAAPGKAVPIPADFIRAKNKPPKQANPAPAATQPQAATAPPVQQGPDVAF